MICFGFGGVLSQNLHFQWFSHDFILVSGFPKNFSIRNIYKFLTFHGELGGENNLGFTRSCVFTYYLFHHIEHQFQMEELQHSALKSWPSLAWGFSPRDFVHPKSWQPEFLQFFFSSDSTFHHSFVCLHCIFFTLYHGKSLLDQYLGNIFYFFPTTLSTSKHS